MKGTGQGRSNVGQHVSPEYTSPACLCCGPLSVSELQGELCVQNPLQGFFPRVTYYF